ncbi:hypothetical protein EGC79_11645 [Shewanella vesiculosa]|uniref:hypothetical protein n=1 Tax=Shewanella vesiculosa TaxID=518738 RepID=UPI000F4E61ED|nr:hypothetical protein [Shewanella vesiculosa]RPA50728.1 hypothetical protein EGC79_11645 [Shewanella vesiculosa]UJL44279.1 hypothetical protein KDH10_001754 [Shewanella vesiculosa]
MNMLSSYVFNVSSQIKNIPNCTVSRAQIFELTAAFLGEKSHAALKKTSLNKSIELAKNDLQAAFIRCQERAISFNQTTKVAQQLSKLISDQLVPLLEKSSVLINQQALYYLTSFGSEWLDVDDDYDEDDLEEDTLQAVESFSFKGFEVDVQTLYTALQQASKDGDKESKLLEFLWILDDLYGVPYDETGKDWYENSLNGKALDNQQQQLADKYCKMITKHQVLESFVTNTQLSDLATPNINQIIESKDFSLIDSICYHIPIDRMLDKLEPYWDLRHDFSNQWLKLFALQDPNRELISHLIERNENPIEQHSWASFAKIYGIDVTQDDHYAIDTNTGEIWDADHDAPIEICGFDGVKLQVLPHELESTVQTRTQIMLELSKKFKN